MANTHTGAAVRTAALVVRGRGLGAVTIPLMALVFRSLQRAEIPDASIITRIATQVGGSFGTAVLAVILGSTVRNAFTPTDTAQAFQHSFWRTQCDSGSAGAASALG